jgi:monovalent cation:H+ antiporter, CPA1 family
MLNPLDLIAILLTLAAGFAYINYCWLRLPATIGLFLLGLIFASVVTGLDAAVSAPGLGGWLRRITEQADLPDILLTGVLGLLLYAAAVNENLSTLLRRKWTILVLATVGVALSTAIMGVCLWLIYGALGVPVPLIWCLVLGAAVSPTDPVAVHGVLNRLPVPETLKATVSGESLFNDGVGVVAFTTLLGMATGSDRGFDIPEVAGTFVMQAFGGGLLGFICGGLAYRAKRRVDESTVELMISLALVMGTYSLAEALHVSGPIAVVVAGLLIGHTTEHHLRSAESRRDLRVFWTMIDSVLNALLFLLVGLEATAIITRAGPALSAAALAVPVALAARLLSLLPALVLRVGSAHKTGALAILTWAGLRGGIAVALVLSMPYSPYRDPLLAACYAIVAFSIVIQGLTLDRVARVFFPGPP